MSDQTFRLILDIRVDDEEALIDYARSRTQTVYGSELEDFISPGDTNVERAILEAMLWSSEGPPYLNVGLEVTDARFE